MDDQTLATADPVEKELLLSKNDFIILNFFTLNLYSIWWTYKSWRFFRDKENVDVEPVWRAIFLIFFQFSLFKKIKRFAVSNGYPANYSSTLLYLGVILFAILAYLPYPYLILTFLNFVCYVPVVEALNQGILKSRDCEFQSIFNIRQRILIGIGVFFWSLIILGFLFS